jgi:hypothetical protein
VVTWVLPSLVFVPDEHDALQDKARIHAGILAERYIQRQYEEAECGVACPKQNMGLPQQLRPNAGPQAPPMAAARDERSNCLDCQGALYVMRSAPPARATAAEALPGQ